ncbi:MAG: 50S ribosomal protein L25 [Pyrinomonadaceae bacterium]
MADKVIVKAEKREGRGKNDSRRLRVEGKVPVVVYGAGGESVAAAASISDLAAILRSDSGYNTVFTLDMAGEGTGDVMFQDRQIDPLRGRLVHADLRRLTKGEKIEVTVAIHLIGEAEGLSEEGAVVNQPLHEIKIIVEPANIPEAINVDVTNLKAGESIHVSDLKVAEGIEFQEAPETVVASIVIVREEELEPQLEAAEPEVIGEKGDDKEGE